ncbi:DedA family protein [Lentilactobacillus sp. SPB1-3]|uniref:DedA family protein n=1 Tax=Lentilactobacillus terminaliae TaxID=3003483 RepID=A0ACD5DE44_9LACO|nr:DedA family protein [Lentilactobacillus sp. SPB1-3]MCZ0977542.1 DedA family protein [Lentilactobacillus sp. SPB1-3]
MSQTQIIELINQYGYWGIIFLIALENIFPPIPSELVLVFAGYLTLSSELNIGGTIIAATVGAYIGAVALYGVGRLLSVQQLEKIVSGRVGKIIHLKSGDIEKAARFFSKYGGKAILFGRCVPVVRSLISIPAGMVNYPFIKFSGFTILGTLIWNTVLILIGHYAGQAWQQILNIVDGWLVIILIVAIVVVGFTIYYRYRRNKIKD